MDDLWRVFNDFYGNFDLNVGTLKLIIVHKYQFKMELVARILISRIIIKKCGNCEILQFVEFLQV